MTPQPFIAVGGQQIMLDGGASCLGFQQHGLAFSSGHPRTAPVDLVVLHDTAGEQDGKGVFATLEKRRLSIHFVIDRKGLIWQFLDPATHVAWHAGAVNGRSVGIETANVVFPPNLKPGLFSNLRKYVLTGKEKLMGRPVVVDDYRGAKRRILGHFEAQKEAARALVAALLEAFPGVPHRLPRIAGTGKLHGLRVEDGWAGVAAHLHFSEHHCDPALDLFDDLDPFLG